MAVKPIAFGNSYSISQNDNKPQQGCQVNPNGVNKTLIEDTAEISTSKNKSKKGWIAATVAAATVVIGAAIYFLSRGKSGVKPLTHIGENTTHIAEDVTKEAEQIIKPKEMEMTAEAKKAYDETAAKLNRKVEVNAETIDKNLTPEEKVGAWSKEDRQSYYQLLEKESIAKTELANFEQQVKSMSREDIMKTFDTISQEQNELYEIGTKRKNAATPTGEKTFWSDYLTPEEKIRADVLNKKFSMAVERNRELRNEFLENHLHKNGDKMVNVPANTKYMNEPEIASFYEYYDIYPDNTLMRMAKGAFNNERTAMMDAGFSKAPALQDDAVVYRAICPHQFKLKNHKEETEFFNSLKKGNTIKDYSYMSTSIDCTNAQFNQFAERAFDSKDGVFMRIKLPKGTKGVFGGFGEYLLPRDSELKIINEEIVDGIKVIEAEYILPKK